VRSRPALAFALGLSLLAPALCADRPAEKPIDVRGVRPSTPSSFEALWSAQRKAEAANEREAANTARNELSRLRVERNVRSLESVALALVGRGLRRLADGSREEAEQDLRQALSLDPSLPDAHFALARAQAAAGPIGYVSAVQTRLSGLLAFARTPRGSLNFRLVALPALFVTLYVVMAAWAATLLVRHGILLRHDVEEGLGPARGRALGPGLLALLLAAPALCFLGWGWLPIWWLALLFTYMATLERVVTCAMVVATVCTGPAAELLERSARLAQDPLYRSMLVAVEGGSDARALAELERASTRNPEDRDLVYLRAMLFRKAGRTDDAASLYRTLLARDQNDVVATNNLANLEFAGRDFSAAIARYKQVAEAGARPAVEATVRYNLSLAYLQRFERQRSDEARAQAERLAPDLVRSYDTDWQYGNGEYAVVDLGLSVGQLEAKMGGEPSRVARENVAGKEQGPGASASLGSLFNRFGAAGLAFALVVLLSHWRRGTRMFTLRCLKCGTPFCRRCHLGAVVAGLCTQCHHLFVVRDGVSGPARNQKLLEVQSEEERRDRVFRALSLFSPGAGQIYGQKPLLGLLFSTLWYGSLVTAVLAGRVLPITEVPAALRGSGSLVLAGLVMVVTYVVANLARPEAEVAAAFSRQRRTRG